MEVERAPAGMESLPPPSAELVLIRIFVASYMATCHLKPHQRARAFLEEAARLLDAEDSLAKLHPIRRSPKREAVVRAVEDAAATFEAMRPMLLAVLAGAERA